MAVPLMPPGVSIFENMAISRCKRTHLKPGSAFAYFLVLFSGQSCWPVELQEARARV